MTHREPGATISPAAGQPGGQQAVGRGPTLLVLVGSILFVAVNSVVSIGADLFQAETEQGRLAVLTADGGSWDRYQSAEAVAIVTVAVGLLLLGRAWGAAFPAARRPAHVAGWLGLLSAAGAVSSVWNIAASPADVAAAYPTSARIVIFGLVLAVALSGAAIGFGVALRRLGHLRWLGWVLMILGPIAALVLSAMVGPAPAYLVWGLAAVVLLAAPPRRP